MNQLKAMKNDVNLRLKSTFENQRFYHLKTKFSLLLKLLKNRLAIKRETFKSEDSFRHFCIIDLNRDFHSKHFS